MHINVTGGVAFVTDKHLILRDTQSMLDLIATVQYDHGLDRIALYKEAMGEDFFRLSTGVAGELLQKVVNYRKQLAIIGDFSAYTSSALADFIRESNRGNAIFFVATEAEAIAALS